VWFLNRSHQIAPWPSIVPFAPIKQKISLLLLVPNTVYLASDRLLVFIVQEWHKQIHYMAQVDK
jgi:hypothetical protein